VEKEHFNNLLVNYTCLTEQEALDLSALTIDFPYSQVIRNLAARAAHDANLPTREKLLHVSAVYSTDRQALKEVMITPKQPRIEPPAEELRIESPESIPPLHSEDSDELRDQVAKDIAALQESRRLFELTIERLEKEKALPLPEKKESATVVEPEPKGNDSLIEEIKSSKKKIKPEGEKQKEQIEIIDRFIKTQPGISRPKSIPPATQDNDLSEPSAQFGENIVSETLVEILLKQGKKERAIEALKKLIWKFPQKKAYFAAQIEELRK
jgi:hypothetical protein